MRDGKIIAVLVLVLLVVFAWAWHGRGKDVNTNNSTSTGSGDTRPAGQTMTLAGGQILIDQPEMPWALAVSAEQVLVHPYIPPCEEGFDYCIYYNGSQYSGTNFESAGLRIERRADLGTERLCLQTPPAGYSANVVPDGTVSNTDYSASVFRSIGGAATGHYANGSLYRLFVRGGSSCYEFETRIGTSQIANYPSGTMREFTEADRQDISEVLQNMLSSVSLTANDKRVVFP